MQKIKLFVDAHVFDGTYQGTTTYLAGLYNALVCFHEFEITIACNNIENAKLHFRHPGFKFIKLASKSKFVRLAYEIPKLIVKNKFDYAHFQYIVPLFRTCKYINTIHDLLFLDYPSLFPFTYRVIKNLTFRFSALRSNIVCTVSDYSRQQLITHYKIHKSKIVITSNAVNETNGFCVDVQSQYKLGKYILFVSRFEPRKNHISLLKAFLELNLGGQGYKLVFVGKRNCVKNSAFENYYEQLDAENRNDILFFENVSIEELNGFYSQAALFVYPSLAEGFGIPPLEAALKNCKVLCSNQTAMGDFKFFKNCLFNPNDLDELKLKMLNILAMTDYPYDDIKFEVGSRYSWTKAAEHFRMSLLADKEQLKC